MMKSKYLVGVVFILVFMHHVSLALAQNDYSGGTGITGTLLDEEPGPDTPEEIEESSAEYPGQYLALMEFFDCHYAERDDSGGSKRIAVSSNEWYGFATVYADSVFTDQKLRELFDLPPFYYLHWYETKGTYVWADLPYTPEVSLEITDDPRLYRFEGKADQDYALWDNSGCVIGVQSLHSVGFPGFTYEEDETTGTLTIFPSSGGSTFGGDGMIESYSSISETTPEIYSTFNKNIVWDEDPDDCAIIGGEWLDTSNYDGNQGNYYQCCGDDYIWVNNRFVTEEETGQEMDIEYDLETIDMDDEDALPALAEKYCLYSKDEDENLLFDYGSCLPTGFSDYDEALDFADDWSADYPEECFDEEENILSTCSYVTTPDERTDLGKWSARGYDGTTSNPNFCRIKEVDDGVPQFAWLDINTAGDLPVDIEGNEITDVREDHAKTICEAYLGGVKTGAYCCGNKYDYNAEFLDEAGYYNESFSDETPIYWYPDKPEEGSYANYACVDGSAIDTKQTAWKKGTDEQQYELLNVGGNLSSCAVENPSILGDDYYKKSPLVEDDSAYDVTACNVVEGQLCSYNPDAEDNQYPWQWEDRTTSSYVRDTLLYSEGDSFTLSTARWATADQQESACCAGNACWDGDACVPAPTFYYYGEDEDSNGLGDEVAICSAGEWQYPTEPKYDWYHNTDAEAVTYCAYPYACVCSSNEDDETFCTENDAYLEAGCTLGEGFYKDDHFCEALDTDSDGSYDSSQWTSRTKFLAFQLLDIAETEETSFTIFCDKYAAAINNYATFEPVEEDINSVCVLEQEGKVIFGISLNSEDDESMAVDANELLFDSGSKSIVPNILEEDAVNNCDDAIAHIPDPTSRFGEFYSCDSSTTTWYNNNLSALIYSKDGLEYTTIIDYPDINDRQNDFDAYKETITTHITDASDDGTLVNPDGTPLSTDFAEFNTIQDYNSLYYNYNADSGNTIFGFQEIKYSENAGDNRYYTAVLYNGYALDCDQVYAPYDTALPVYCNSEGIVLERSTSGSEYWNDLTAAIRVE